VHGRGVAEGIIADFVKDLVRRNRIIPKLDPNIHRPRILWKNHSLLSRLGTLLITKSSRCSRRPTDERDASLRFLFVPQVLPSSNCWARKSNKDIEILSFFVVKKFKWY